MDDMRKKEGKFTIAEKSSWNVYDQKCDKILKEYFDDQGNLVLLIENDWELKTLKVEK